MIFWNFQALNIIIFFVCFLCIYWISNGLWSDTVSKNGADQKEDDLDSKAVQQAIAPKTEQRVNTGNGTESKAQSLSICLRAEPPKFDRNSTESVCSRYRVQLTLSPIYGLCGALKSQNRLHSEMSPKCLMHQIPKIWGFGQNSDSFWFHLVFTMKMIQTFSLNDDVDDENTQKNAFSVSVSLQFSDSRFNGDEESDLISGGAAVSAPSANAPISANGAVPGTNSRFVWWWNLQKMKYVDFDTKINENAEIFEIAIKFKVSFGEINCFYDFISIFFVIDKLEKMCKCHESPWWNVQWSMNQNLFRN